MIETTQRLKTCKTIIYCKTALCARNFTTRAYTRYYRITAVGYNVFTVKPFAHEATKYTKLVSDLNR